MAHDDRVSMPMSGAGITRFFDEVKSRIQIKPFSVVILIVVVVLIIALLHMYGYNLLGIGNLN
jgi:preprotein translocase subunit Sec61beta